MRREVLFNVNCKTLVLEDLRSSVDGQPTNMNACIAAERCA